MRAACAVLALLLLGLCSGSVSAANARLESLAERAEVAAAVAAQAKLLQPTKFLISNFGEQASGQKQVTYDECGQPLCPGKVVATPPPAAYVCDCTRADAHPDCLCGNGNSASGASCNCAPGERCPCNTGAIVGANYVAPPQAPSSEAAIIKGFRPAMNPPEPLPDPQAHECKPNVFGVGPGTCRKTPQARVCASGDSNCLFNSNSIAFASSSSSSSSASAAAVRIQPAGCACSQPAPAPCNCVNQPGTNSVADAGDLIGDETDRKFMEELKAMCRRQPSCQLPNTPTAAETGALSLEGTLLKNEVNTFKSLFDQVQKRAQSGSGIEKDILQKGLDAMQSAGVASPASLGSSSSMASSSMSAIMSQPTVSSGSLRGVPTASS